MLRPPGKTYLGFVSIPAGSSRNIYIFCSACTTPAITMNIRSAMTSGANYFFCCLLLTQPNHYFQELSSICFRQQWSRCQTQIFIFCIFSKPHLFFLSNCNSPRFMRWQCVRPTKSRCYITDRCTPYNRMADKSTLLQVMTLCRQATNRCLSQRRPRPMSPYGVTMLQWVDIYVCISNVFLLLSIYGIFIRASFSGSIIN